MCQKYHVVQQETYQTTAPCEICKRWFHADYVRKEEYLRPFIRIGLDLIQQHRENTDSVQANLCVNLDM